MRILLSTDTSGGVWDYSTTFARALEQEGHAVLMAAIGDPTDDQVADLPEGIVLTSQNLPLEWMPGSADHLPRTALWLASLARAWKANVVHLNQMAYTGLTSFPAPTVVVVHSDVSSWYREVRGTRPPGEWTPYLAAVRAGLHAATRIVAPTNYQANLVVSGFGREVDRVIHNGAELPAGISNRSSIRNASARSERGERESIVLAVGRAWDEAKGMAVLDRAIGLLGSKAPSTHLLGPLEGPGGASFAGVHLTTHGRVDSRRVAEWMRRAAVLVSPSLYEPFGLAPLEGALRGCALLLSDIGSFRELWDGCAEFFAKGSARSLADALEGMIGDPARVARLAAAARKRALERYTAERFVAEYLDLYRSLMEPVAATSLMLAAAPPIGGKD